MVPCARNNVGDHATSVVTFAEAEVPRDSPNPMRPAAQATDRLCQSSAQPAGLSSPGSPKNKGGEADPRRQSRGPPPPTQGCP